MPIYKSTFFPESALAHQLLGGLKGLEVGGSRAEVRGELGVGGLHLRRDGEALREVVLERSRGGLQFLQLGEHAVGEGLDARLRGDEGRRRGCLDRMRRLDRALAGYIYARSVLRSWYDRG